MHALEVAKCAWNELIVSGDGTSTKALPNLMDATEWYLSVAHHVLYTLGPEGDTGGPLEEIQTLQSLISHRR
jgi:hypothetical protein